MEYDFDKPICELKQGDIAEFYDVQTLIERILREDGKEIPTTRIYVYDVRNNLIKNYIKNRGIYYIGVTRISAFTTCVWGIDENGEIREIDIDHFLMGDFKVVNHIEYRDILEKIFQVGDMNLTQEQKWEAKDREESYKYFNAYDNILKG